ncbi:MAG: sensor domain-containing protein [Chloroflexota bacterium]
MSAQPSAIMPNFLSRVVQPVFQRQSYLSILYALLAFPLGIIYFTFLVVGLTLTVGLLISLPVLLATLGMIWAFSAVERNSTIWLLNVDIPRAQSPTVTNQNVGARVGGHLLDTNTWKRLVYLLAKFPIGILSFTVAIFLIALTVGLLITPFTYTGQVVQVYFFGWKIDTLYEALLASLIGLGIGVISIHVINGLAFMQGQFARLMLGSPKSGTTGSQ